MFKFKRGFKNCCQRLLSFICLPRSVSQSLYIKETSFSCHLTIGVICERQESPSGLDFVYSEMALNFNKVNFNVRKTSVNVTVPNSPVAPLMYYLNSTCSLLQLDTSDSPNLQRLTLYNSSWILTAAQKRELTVLCSILSPEKLLNKCIFIDKSLTGLNDFYEISAVHNQMLVSRSIIINGQRKRVNKIMICRPVWLQRY